MTAQSPAVSGAIGKRQRLSPESPTHPQTTRSLVHLRRKPFYSPALEPENGEVR
jgi:hypothetical protein